MLLHVLLSFSRIGVLRFVDYFHRQPSPVLSHRRHTGCSRLQQSCRCVDVTRSIQWQRFFNSVNRTGRKISQYIKGLFPGNDMAPDYHNPLYLGHTSDIIYASNVENTGDAQMQQSNSVTATLKSMRPAMRLSSTATVTVLSSV